MSQEKRSLQVRSLSREEVSDIADRATLDHERTVEAKIASIRSGLFREAEIAWFRKKAGIFGTCEDCGGEISPKRLAAEPNAVKCIDCQEEEERRAWRKRSFR